MSIYQKIFADVPGLTEEFAVNADTLITAHINEQVDLRTKELSESHAAEIASLTEQADAYGESIVQSLTEHAEAYAKLIKEQTASDLDAYLGVYLKEWADENQPAIQSNLKVQLAESLLDGISGLMTDHNLEVPSADLMEDFSEQLATQTSLTESVIQENESMIEELNSLRREKIINEATANLANTQRDRVVKLTECFDTDELFNARVQAITEQVSAADVADESDINADVNVDQLNERLEVDNVDEQRQSNPNTAIEETLRFMNRNKL